MIALLISLLVNPPPPAEVRAPLRRLGHRSFAVREKAQAQLRALGRRAEPALRRAARSSPDLEVRRRAQGLLARLEAEATESFAPWPMIDALWYCEEQRRYAVAGEFTPEGLRFRLCNQYLVRRGSDGPPWNNYRAATRDLAADWLAAGVPARLLRAVLAEMRRRDQLFLDHHYGGRCPGLAAARLPETPEGRPPNARP